MKPFTLIIKPEDTKQHPLLKKAVEAYKQASRGEKRDAFFKELKKDDNGHEKLEEKLMDEQFKLHECLSEISILRDYLVILLRENKQLQNKIEVYERD